MDNTITKAALLTSGLSLLGGVAGIFYAVNKKSGFWGGVGFFFLGSIGGSALGYIGSSMMNFDTASN